MSSRTTARPFADVVDGTWQAAADEPPRLILPDGCVDVMADGGGLRIIGPMTQGRRVVFSADPPRGIRFRPATIRAWLGVSPEELVDAVVDAQAFRRLRGVEDLRSVVALARGARLAPKPVRALARLLEGTPSASIGRTATRWGISERHLRRTFTVEVGLSPKRFARIQRLRALARLFRADLRSASSRSLAASAAEAGYADQAHMNREVRQLAAVRPTDLRTEVSESFKTRRASDRSLFDS